MAFEAFIPNQFNLDGVDAIREGYPWRRKFKIERTIQGVTSPVNMAEYNATPPVIVLKDKVTEQGGQTTGCPVGVCIWTDANAGEYQVDMVGTATNQGTGSASNQKPTGVYETYVSHNTEFDDPPTNSIKKRAIVHEGTWAIKNTVAAT